MNNCISELKIDIFESFLINLDIIYVMDEKNRQILDVLKKDSRTPVREIGKQLSIKPSTVHLRIKKMVESGLIEKFTVKLDNAQAMENFIVFMLVSGKSSQYLHNKFMNNPCVKEVFGITGEYDMMIKMKFAGIEEFNNFILDFRETYADSIEKTVTMISTVTLKEEV